MLLAGGCMRQLLAGMSPRSGVSHVPRLRAETHFGVQARALPAGLHQDGNENGWKDHYLF